MNALFDTAPDRTGSGSYKWDTTTGGIIPMWVADMDFRVADPILEALRKRVAHGIFGYTHILPEYYDAVRDWFRLRHGWDMGENTILHTSGIVPAISAIIKALAPCGSRVALQTPAYNCFFSSIRNNGCRIAENTLIRREDEPGILDFTIDFDGLEEIFAQGDTPLMILCNPHNPTGRIWTEEELTRIATLAAEYSVTVISDEIHCDITLPGLKYNPFAPIAEKCGCRYAVCTSPSKTFNTAGLQIANITVPQKGMAALIDKAININEICDVNPFGPVALTAAYRECAGWADSLREYIAENFAMYTEKIRRSGLNWTTSRPQATYLAWTDVSAEGENGDSVAEKALENGVRIASGSTYGDPGFIRINLACPRSRAEEGINRLIKSARKN